MPKVPGYSDEDLAMLTEEERNGLLEGAVTATTDDAEDDDTTTAGAGDDTLAAGAADDESGEGNDEGGDDDTDADAGTQDDGKAADSDTTTGGAGDDTLAAGSAEDAGPIEVEIDDLGAPVTTYNIADAQTKIKTIDEQMDALAKQADDGEIDLQTLTARQRELQDQRDDLKADVRYAENHVRDAISTFRSHADAFLAKPENAPYRSGLFNKLLDDTVRQVQAVAIENGRNAFDPKIIDKAVAIVDGQLATRFGARAAPKDEGGAKPGPKPAPKPQRNLPPNLSAVPAADDGGNPLGAGGEYALAARLAEEAPLKYEKMLASWPKEKVEDFLSRGI